MLLPFWTTFPAISHLVIGTIEMFNLLPTMTIFFLNFAVLLDCSFEI